MAYLHLLMDSLHPCSCLLIGLMALNVSTSFALSECLLSYPFPKRNILIFFSPSLQCGFFKRAKYEEKVPSYNAVWIKREERAISPGNGMRQNLEKKPWMTTWHDKEHYS